MRIAVVTTSYPVAPGSFAGHFVRSEARTLAQEGHDVLVCAAGPNGIMSLDGIRVACVGGARLFRSPGSLSQLRRHPLYAVEAIRFVVSARRWLKDHGPFDAIHAHWLVPCGWPVATDLGSPLTVVCHGSDIELLQRLPQPVTRGIVKSLHQCGANFRCVSNSLASKLSRLAPELSERITVAASPIDLPHVPERSLARHMLGVAPSTTVIVIIARLIPEKRVEVALSGLATLVSTTSAIQVVVIGAGPERSVLERRYPFAHFLGELPREQALLWLRGADLLLSASELEGAPTAVREARALGVPVVSTIAGDLLEWAERDPAIHLFSSSAELLPTLERVLAHHPASPASGSTPASSSGTPPGVTQSALPGARAGSNLSMLRAGSAHRATAKHSPT